MSPKDLIKAKAIKMDGPFGAALGLVHRFLSA
jgi:hypothetical protein